MLLNQHRMDRRADQRKRDDIRLENRHRWPITLAQIDNTILDANFDRNLIG